MNIKRMVWLKGLDGEMAVDPEQAYFVTGETSVCHIHMTGGVILHAHAQAEDVATALWGYWTKTGGCCFNPGKIIAAISIDQNSCMLHFTADDTVQVNTPIRLAVEGMERMGEYRDGLDQLKV